MQLLTLHEPPEAPSRRLTRAEAIALSLLLHLLVLILVARGVKGLPGPLAQWVEALTAPAPAAERRASDAAAPVTPAQAPPPEAPRIPVRFAYVKVPEDGRVERNPQAHLLSDRDRLARQELPTPPDARRLTLDPHSKGDSINRVSPDPRLKEGKDEPVVKEAANPENGDRLAELGPDLPKAAARADSAADEPEGPGARSADSAGGSGTGAAAPNGSAPLRAGEDAQRGGGRKPLPDRGTEDPGAGGGSRASVAELRSGSEFKFRFDNSGWLRGGAYGTLSFDTKGFPWGDYARQIYVIIRNNWLERIPLAAREGGLQGYTCQHFFIGRDGVISELDVVRPSSIPPYNKAASDALRASSALPALPADFDADREGLTFCFYYNMYPGEAD